MEAGQSFRSVTLDNTLVSLWWGDPTVPWMQRYGEELEALARAHPKGIHALCVVLATCGMPDAAGRALMQRQFETMRGRLSCMAVAFEKPGVAGSLSRAVLSTLSTITRRPFKMSIYFRRAEAAQWLAQQPSAPAGSRLLESLDQIARAAAA